MTIEPTSNWTHAKAPHYTVTVADLVLRDQEDRPLQFVTKDEHDADWFGVVPFMVDGSTDNRVLVLERQTFLARFILTDDFVEGQAT